MAGRDRRGDGGRTGRGSGRPPAGRKREAPARPSEAAEKPFKVAGLPAVEALFARDPDRVERLYFDERFKTRAGDLCTELARRRRPYRLVDSEELARIAGGAMHGGIVAFTRPRPVPPFDHADAAGWAAAGEPLLLLDGVGNPHNLGAVVRTMAFFGLPRLLLSDHPAQAGPSEASYRVAEGGMEHVELYRAERFPSAVKRLRERYRVVGTSLERGRPLAELPEADRPLAFVLGNEEEGLPRATADACDELVRIPGAGRVQSMNVSATAAILIWELIRRSRRR